MRTIILALIALVSLASIPASAQPYGGGWVITMRAMAGTLAHPGIGAVRESMTGGTMARPALASMKGADRTATDMAGSSVLEVCALRPAATAIPVQVRSTRPVDVTSAASDRSVVPSVFKPG